MESYTSSPIKVLFWNCHSISNKKIQLQYYLQQNNPDIVMLSETCLKDTSLNLANYSEFHKDRQNVKKKCGGVAILVKKTIDRVKFYDIPFPLEDIEANAIVIETTNSNKVFFVSVYCNITLKEESKKLEELNGLIQIFDFGCTFYICGDFNTKQENLKKLIKHGNVTVLYPNEDSFVPNSLSKQNSIIDAMITNNVKQPNLQLAVDKTLFSDHYAVKFEVNDGIFLKRLAWREHELFPRISKRTIELIQENIALKSAMMEKKRLYYSEEINQIFEASVDFSLEDNALNNAKTVIQDYFVYLNNLLRTNNSEHEIELKSVLRVVKKHFEELSQTKLNVKYIDNLKEISSPNRRR